MSSISCTQAAHHQPAFKHLQASNRISCLPLIGSGVVRARAQLRRHPHPTLVITCDGVDSPLVTAWCVLANICHHAMQLPHACARHAHGVLRLQADVGVDAGAYARQLMNGAKEEAEADTCKRQDSSLSAPSILQRAYERTTYQGEHPNARSSNQMYGHAIHAP